MSPVSVVISASEMPPATTFMVFSPPPPLDKPSKVVSIPVTVPSNPHKGAAATVTSTARSVH